MAINFAKVLEAQLGNEEGSQKSKRVGPGIYKTVIRGVNPSKVYKSGAEGLEIEYSILEGEFTGEVIRERIITKLKNGSDNAYSFPRIKRRLMTGGFTVEGLSKFKDPKSEKEIGDYVQLIGKRVTVTTDNETVKSGEYAGQQMLKVLRVEKTVD